MWRLSGKKIEAAWVTHRTVRWVKYYWIRWDLVGGEIHKSVQTQSFKSDYHEWFGTWEEANEALLTKLNKELMERREEMKRLNSEFKRYAKASPVSPEFDINSIQKGNDHGL